MGARTSTSKLITHTDLHKLNNKLVGACWSTFNVWTNHMQIRIHKTHHGLDLREATTFLLIIYSMHCHGTNTKMSFCPGTPKWEFGNSQNWDFHNFGGP
jgi:hypothetical protein